MTLVIKHKRRLIHASHHLQEEFRVAADGGLEKSIPVGRLLGDRLAECKGVAAGVSLCQVKMMSGNGC